MPLSNTATAQVPPELILSTQIDRTLESQQILHTFNAENTGLITTGAPANIEIKINNDMWLNPSSSYFRFDAVMNKTSGGGVITKNGIISMFRRIRILLEGHSTETIEDPNVLARILQITGEDEHEKKIGWSQGYSLPVTTLSDTTVTPSVATTERFYVPAATNTEQTQRFTIHLMTGFFSYAKLLPMMGFPEVTILFELNTYDEATYHSGANAVDGIIGVRNMQYVAELHQLPGTFNQSVMSQIENGGLEFSMPTFQQRTYNISAGSTGEEHEIRSSVKSVKALYFVQRLADNISNSDVETSDAGGDIAFVTDGLDAFQLRVGGQYYPQQFLDVGPESLEELAKSRQRDLTPMFKTGYSIEKREYLLAGASSTIIGKAVYGIDLEKFLSSTLTSGTSFSNQNIVLRTRRSTGAVANTKLYVYIYYDMLVRIKERYKVVVTY